MTTITQLKEYIEGAAFSRGLTIMSSYPVVRRVIAGDMHVLALLTFARKQESVCWSLVSRIRDLRGAHSAHGLMNSADAAISAYTYILVQANYCKVDDVLHKVAEDHALFWARRVAQEALEDEAK